MTTPNHADVVKKIHFDDVVAQIRDLPMLPEVVTDLMQSIDQEDIDIGVLAKKIAHDQALAAKTLRFANSSLYVAKSKVTTIQQAISLLGLQGVRNIIMAAAMSGSFPENACHGFDFKAFWRHSMATAVCAKVLARHLHLNQDFAFTAGLLHDIGRLVMVTRFPQIYEAVIAYRAKHDCYLLDAERTVAGIDHTVVGNVLAQHWHFSETIQYAITGHHEPEALGAGSLASLIHIADAIAHALDLAGVEDDLVPPVSLVAWHGVGLDANIYMHVFRETELEFEEMNRVL
jgi:putative nucleotidyltransferase with HDIG domain